MILLENSKIEIIFVGLFTFPLCKRIDPLTNPLIYLVIHGRGPDPQVWVRVRVETPTQSI